MFMALDDDLSVQIAKWRTSRWFALLCGFVAFANVFALGSTMELWRNAPNPWGFSVFTRDVTFWSWLANLSSEHEGTFWSCHSANVRKSCVLILVTTLAGWLGYWVVYNRLEQGPESDYRDGPHGTIKDGRFDDVNGVGPTTPSGPAEAV
jgi:hypothetical protein